MKIASIGLGLIGSRRLRLAQSAGHELALAVDPDPQTWPKPAAGSCRCAARLAEIEGASAEAALIAVPHDQAFAATRWALEHGMHVLCEKPLGLNAAEAAQLCGAAADRGLRLAVGFNYRFLVGVIPLRELIKEGRFGKIHRVRMLLAHGGRPGMESEWKLRRESAGGGALMDPGIHLLDLVRFLVGEPRVQSTRLRLDFWSVDVEDNARIELSCGATDISLEISLTHWQNQFRIEIYGADAMALATGRGGNYGSQHLQFVNRWFWQPGNDQRQLRDLGTNDESFELETKAFLDWAAGLPRHPSLATGADGLRAAELVEAAYAQAPANGFAAAAVL